MKGKALTKEITSAKILQNCYAMFRNYYDSAKGVPPIITIRSIAGKERICALLFVFLLLLGFHAFADSDIRYVYTENGGSLNLRDRPSKNGTIMERLPLGTQVKILQEDPKWSKIACGDKTGYVRTTYLKSNNSDKAEDEWKSVSGSMYVNTKNKTSLHLREKPSRSSRSLALIENGTRVQVTEISSSWAHVNVNGKEGYMMNSFLINSAPQEKKGTGEMFIKGSGTVSVYQEPDTGSKVVLSIPGGTKVRVSRQQGKWSQIVVNGTLGYVPDSYLTQAGPEIKDEKAAIIVNPNGASYVNLRSKPGIKSAHTVLTHIKVNTSVRVIGRSGTWRKIIYNDLVGYVYHRFLQYK